mmetsp:Transcript_30450/g.35681  ORF Transcript_30450/g.35681 Transcript_30450/m.35681 type:complete len:94 (+) Transcript_30450:385-666(+)
MARVPANAEAHTEFFADMGRAANSAAGMIMPIAGTLLGVKLMTELGGMMGMGMSGGCGGGCGMMGGGGMMSPPRCCAQIEGAEGEDCHEEELT